MDKQLGHRNQLKTVIAVIATEAYKQFVGLPEASWQKLLDAESVSLDFKVLIAYSMPPLKP